MFSIGFGRTRNVGNVYYNNVQSICRCQRSISEDEKSRVVIRLEDTRIYARVVRRRVIQAIRFFLNDFFLSNNNFKNYFVESNEQYEFQSLGFHVT